METIKIIMTQAAIEQIIEIREPRGLFLHKDKNDNWVAIDNSTGDAWTEDFKIKQDAIDWLEKINLKNEK